MWHGEVIWTFSQNVTVSSLALPVWEWRCSEDFEEKNKSINELMNYKDLCRTALATPGLVIITVGKFSVWQPENLENLMWFKFIDIILMVLYYHKKKYSNHCFWSLIGFCGLWNFNVKRKTILFNVYIFMLRFKNWS